jgi:hypothetical protein
VCVCVWTTQNKRILGSQKVRIYFYVNQEVRKMHRCKPQRCMHKISNGQATVKIPCQFYLMET